MLAKLRARLTYANVMATVAVFIALGGSSYAALTVTGKNVKNSSLTGKDVKNNSLTGSDIKSIKSGDVSDHSLLSKDFKAGQLPAGPKGDKGNTGDRGPAGPFPDGNLPSGKTIRGTTAIYDKAAGAGEYSYDNISYGFRLASEPTLHYVKAGTTPPSQCPGSATDPAATPGNLCVYEGFAGNAGSDRSVVSGGFWSVDGRSGAQVYTSSLSAGSYDAFTAWAVTAP